MPVFRGVLLLLLADLAGEFATRLLGLGVPGHIIGMLLFLAILAIGRPAENAAWVAAPALLLRHLQLLFIPAGVGIVVYLHRLGEDAVPLAVGMGASWLIGFALTALVVRALLRLRRPEGAS